MRDYLSNIVNKSLTEENRKTLNTGGYVELPDIAKEDIERMQRREENLKFGAGILMMIGLIPCILQLFSM